MKKFLKIFSIIFVLVFITFIVVCAFVIPEQTKNTFDIIVDYINKPLPIIGISILSLGIVIFTIISKLGLGKKKVNQIEKDFNELKTYVNECLESSEEQIKNATLLKEYIEAFVKAHSSELDYFINELIKACKTSPNAKIKAIGEEIEQHLEELVDKDEEILGLDDDMKGLGVQNGEETTND